MTCLACRSVTDKTLHGEASLDEGAVELYRVPLCEGCMARIEDGEGDVWRRVRAEIIRQIAHPKGRTQ